MAETANQREGRTPYPPAVINPLDPTGYAPVTIPTTSTNSSGGSSRSKSKPTTYNKAAADALIEQELLNALGINASAKVKSEFFKGLNAYLKAYGSTSGSKSSGSGSTSYTIQGADASVYVKQFIGEVIKDAYKANPKVKFGGIVGDTVNVLTKYSADMGIFKSASEIANNAIDVTTGKARQEDLLTRYRKDAQALYANFAPRLAEDASLTVRDLANPYIQMMSDIFEDVPDNIKLTDDTIQKAISGAKGVMNLGDFRTMLRNDSRFGVTSTAKREAADLGTSMLRSMGF
jgi:hypothetical protein